MEEKFNFWEATVEELKAGFYYNKSKKAYVCLICEKSFKKGIVYPVCDVLHTAKGAVSAHIENNHGDIFEFFLAMGKVYTGLTENQRELMRFFYQGLTDREIVDKTNATSTSTIRNQRFALREKYKQAKIIVAMTELLEERRNNMKNEKQSQNETLVDFHRTATMIDERYAITSAEKEEVLSRYFDSENRLIIKTFPAKEKKKIIILQHLAEEFEHGKKYTEKEVNAIIENFYEDIPTIRRYLIEYGFLDREKDGRAYWLKL